MVHRRRVLLGLAAGLAVSRRVGAQSAVRMPRVAIVFNGGRDLQKLATESFLQGMALEGYVNGRDVELDLRYAARGIDELPEIVRELLARGPDVIVLSGSQAIWAGRNATASVPIVMSSVGNPVGQGLIESLARPGGNLTGLALMAEVLATKRLELLREILPRATRVGRLYNPANPAAVLSGRQEEEAAARLGIDLLPFDARNARELDRALQAISAQHPQAVTVSEDALFAGYGEKLIAAFSRDRIPSMYGWPQFVVMGGLISYAADTRDQFLRSASYVARILRGANPAELPVEQATRFELYINLKTARDLGVSIPLAVRLRADSVIE